LKSRKKQIRSEDASDPKIIHRRFDKSFTVNEWIPGLKPIVISLPKPPEYKLIDNFWRVQDQQFFRKEIYPEKLTQLEKSVRLELKDKKSDGKNRDLKATEQEVINLIWDTLEKKADFYEKELAWIRKQWYHRLYGYWFFNNGVATYIDGWHWYYLNYWYMIREQKGDTPEYRDRDRKQFLITRYVYTTHETFKFVDDETRDAIPNEDGTYEMVELSGRTLLGEYQTKNRRGGNTNMFLCIEVEVLSRTMGSIDGLNQSFDAAQIDNARNILMNAWERLPFFFKPMWQGRNRPEKLLFRHDGITNSLGSRITIASNSDASYGEGSQAKCRLYDEEGKSYGVKIRERASIGIHTMSEGNGSYLKGLSYHPSTVSDMHGEVAQEFLDLCMESDFYKRSKLSGQTQTKCIFIYFPAWYCLAKFIGRFGESIHDDPTPEQIRQGFDKPYGSKEKLQRDRDDLLSIGTESAMRDLRILRKEFPFDLEDLYLKSENSILDFDYEGMERRNFKIKHSNPPLFLYYDLFWENNIKDSRVLIRQNPNGRFCMSMQLEPSDTNKRKRVQIRNRQTGRLIDTWIPENIDKHIIGADPFAYTNRSEAEIRKNARLLSDGGIAERFLNGRLFVTYIYRPLLLKNNLMQIDKELKEGIYSYCEDIILLAVFTGSMVYPENNNKAVNEYLAERGYAGYLLHQLDENGLPRIDAGGWSGTDKTSLFEFNKAYTNEFLNVECHSDFLDEMLVIKSIKDMTNHDLFTSVAYCNWGNKILNDQLGTGKKEETIENKIGNISPFFRY
jgi:hypothetical protein